MKKVIIGLFASIILMPTILLAQSHKTANYKKIIHSKDKQMDIVDIAVSSKMFKTLVAAVKAADLVEALKSEGPFTVFAPTDEAFSKLPKGTIDELLRPENREKLLSILTYHVVPGKVEASDVVKMKMAKTAQGESIKVSVKDGGVFLDGNTKVIKTDIVASNGIIHVVDSVLMPSMKKDIVDTAISTNMFNTLVAAVKAAGLVDTLKGNGPFTVLAPTDEAFQKLPKGTVENLLKPENKDLLVKILTYHVISGDVKKEQAVKLRNAKTLQGQKVKIRARKGMVRINNAKVVKADVEASNGTIHVIDTVLMPK